MISKTVKRNSKRQKKIEEKNNRKQKLKLKINKNRNGKRKIGSLSPDGGKSIF